MRLQSLYLLTFLVKICSSLWYGKEGSYATTGCTFRPRENISDYTSVQWSMFKNNSFINVAQCSRDGRCSTTYPGLSVSLFNNYTSLTIKNVSRTSETNYSCRFLPLPDEYVEPLQIFATPKNVICSSPVVNNSSIEVTCIVDRIFPQGQSRIELSTNNISFYASPVFNCTSTEIPGTPVYYTSVCTARTSATDRINIGTNYLRVNIFFCCYLSAGLSNTFLFTADIKQIPANVSFSTTTVSSNVTLVTAIDHISKSSDSGLVIGLAVATAIFGAAVVALGIFLLINWLRQTKMATVLQKQTSPEVTQGYNRTDQTRSSHGDGSYHIYEPVNNSKTALPGQQQGTQQLSQTNENGDYVNLKDLQNGTSECEDVDGVYLN